VRVCAREREGKSESEKEREIERETLCVIEFLRERESE
jgi:hypothetical protein